MNKKIINDFKVVRKKVTKPSNGKVINEVENTQTLDDSSHDKYDFLKKRYKPQSSFQRIPQTPVVREGKSVNKGILYLFSLAIIVGGLYLLSTVFLRANIVITAKNKTLEVKHQKFTAGEKSNNIPFELMIVTDVYPKDVTLISSSDVSIKARGEITLYNEFSNKPEKITSGAFLSDEKGKSYKTDATVTIPGYTLDKAKKVVPGKVNVAITSFLAGDAYNGSPENFSVTSYKGTSKYSKIYGKIKKELSGGMAGLVYTLDDKQKESILADSLIVKEKLLRKLNAQIPEGYISYPDAFKVKYEIPENFSSKTAQSTININGTLSAFLIKKNALSDAVIGKLLPDISGKEKAEIVPPDLSLLSFKFTSKDQLISKEVESFEFELNNNLPISWKPNIFELQKLLVSKDKSLVEGIFKEDPGISSAKVTIIPFWSKALPENKNSIHIRLE